jgi:hypothetical protein
VKGAFDLSDLLRGITFGGSGPIRGLAFDLSGLLRGITFGGSDLIKRVCL